MRTLSLKREIPLDDSWDVIIVGGGPSGCTAAAAAAREGRRTLLLESTGSLGGMGTSGLVPAWCPFSDQQKVIYRGLAEKVFNASKANRPQIKPTAVDWVSIDPERLKRIYDDLVTEFGAEVRFHTMLAGVETGPGGVVESVIVNNKGGLQAFKAKVYVDCTGDADLAAWAGASFEKGEVGTGELQPATPCFELSNVDEFHFNAGKPWNSRSASCPMKKIQDSGRYPLIRDGHFCVSHVGPGTVGFNAGHLWNVDNTNPASLSKALMDGRKLAAQFRDALAEQVPQVFGNSFLVSTGALLGIRETRRIMGDYVLSIDDYLSRRSFDDEIARSCYCVDIHPSIKELEKEKAGKIDLDKRYEHYAPGESHGIPYRCLTPKGLKNVLVAGRSISCDRPLQGAVRVMPSCLVTGEAAGTAAAQAVQQNDHDVHALNVGQLRERLKANGAYLPDVK